MKTILLRPKEIEKEPFAKTFEPSDSRDVGCYGDRAWLLATRKVLAEKCYDMITIDEGDSDDADKILIMGYHNDVYFKECVAKGLQSKMIYQELEFPCDLKPVEGGYAPRSYLDSFGKVVTWEKDLVDNERVFYIQYPNNRYKGQLPEVSFESRDLLCLANTNKESPMKEELYSERKKAILFFQDKIPMQFNLFGSGWKRSLIRYFTRKLGKKDFDVTKGSRLASWVAGEPYYGRCLRGFTSNIYETYAEHRFAIVYESMGGLRGSISGKIFDCLMGGCVPIYLGASDIDELIPEECFIDKRKFSYEELLRLIENMNEKDWMGYVVAGQEYLDSPVGKRNFDEDWARDFVEVILR